MKNFIISRANQRYDNYEFLIAIPSGKKVPSEIWCTLINYPCIDAQFLLSKIIVLAFHSLRIWFNTTWSLYFYQNIIKIKILQHHKVMNNLNCFIIYISILHCSLGSNDARIDNFAKITDIIPIALFNLFL